jgi:hypothetical protein
MPTAVHLCWTYHSAWPSHRLDAGSVREAPHGAPLSKCDRGPVVSAAFDPAVTSYADADRLLRTEPQVQLTNPPVLNNHSNDFKSHLHEEQPPAAARARRFAAKNAPAGQAANQNNLSEERPGRTLE